MENVGGAASLAMQLDELLYMQQGATANGNGTVADVQGYTGAQQVEITETEGGTATVTLQGSMDGTAWYSVGYQRVDGQASLTRSVSAISVTANLSAVFQVLDPYRQLRAVVSSISGATVTARVYLVPA